MRLTAARGRASARRGPRGTCLAARLGVTAWLGALAAGAFAQQAPDAPQPAPSPAERWQLSGAQLRGSVDGPIEIDSVVIVHGGLEIGARHGRWLPASELLELEGEVEIRDSVRVLHSARGLYRRRLSRLELEEDVRGRGPEGDFRSDRLLYERQRRRLMLTGAVRLVEAQRTLDCNWLHYDLADSFATAGDQVELREAGDSVTVQGTLLFYDRRAGEMTVLGEEGRRPRLLRQLAGRETPMIVEADTLRLDVRTHTGEACGAVTIAYAGARGGCRRARYAMDRNQVWMTGDPALADGDGQIAGDTLQVELRDGRPDRMRVWGGARSEYHPRQVPGERYFAVGDTLTAYLDDDAIRTVLLEGNAEAIYLPPARDRQQGVGLNWTRGDRIRLTLAAQGVTRVQIEGNVSGRYVQPPETPAAAASDSATAPETPSGAYSPAVLTALRAMAREGHLDPPDSLLSALPFDRAEEVAYRGREIDYDVPREEMVIRGEGQVAYQGMELASEEITFRSGQSLVLATGEPVLSDEDSEIAGTRMTYRIDTRQGLVFQGRSELETGHYRGARIKQVTRRELFVEGGEFTTCDADSPHFHFQAGRMKIVPGEKVIARPVVLYIGHIPLLAIPYAVFPIRRGRQSGILIPDVEVGFDTSRGRFLKNLGYYWAPSDYLDALFWLDYYEEDPSTTLNLRSRYKLRYHLDGQFEASFTRQNNYLGGRRDRWLVRLHHDQALGQRFSLKISGHYQSDKDYGADRDFGAGVDERINRQLRSQLSLSKSWSFASLSLVADRTEYLDDCEDGSSRITQAVPNVTFSLNSFPLGTAPDARGRGGHVPLLATTYLRGNLRYRSVYEKGCGARETNQAAAIDLSLSDKRRLFGVINLTPSASFSGAWAHENDAGERDLTGAVWRAGFSAGTTLYGTFFPRLGPWEALRHVIDLSASYSYRPEIRGLADFPSVGGISLGSSKASGVSLRATQRFHLKYRVGEEVRKRDNLLTWTTSTAYDFLEQERAREANRAAHPWSDFQHSLRLQPGGFLSNELSITHDAERWREEYRLSLRNTLRLQGGGESPGELDEAALAGHGGFGDPSGAIDRGPGGSGLRDLTGPWHVTLSHALSRSRSGTQRSKSSSANVSLGLGLTRNWRLQYSIYYDLTDEEVTSQGFTLYRDLHCWQAVLERRSSGGRASYYFRISVKDLPDLKYERRRSGL